MKTTLRVVVMTFIFIFVIPFAVPSLLRGQEVMPTKPKKKDKDKTQPALFVSVQAGKMANYPGVGTCAGLRAKWVEGYGCLSSTWHTENVDGGVARVNQQVRYGGFNFRFPKVFGIRPLLGAELGTWRNLTTFHDPMGDSFREVTSDLHAAPGFGVERDIGHGLSLECFVRKQLKPNPETRGLWDIETFASFTWQLPLGHKKKADKD